MYRTYNARPVPRGGPARRQRTPLIFLGGLLLIITVYCGYALLRPLPSPRVVITPPVLPALVKVNLPWPAAAPKEQSAYGAMGYGLLASSRPAGSETPLPTASVAKVITALAVLDKKPLKPGEQGPAITISAHDVDLYNQYIAKEGSVVPVAAGETISEYQALQAMMLPSANNIADTLAEWAYGSLTNYNTSANSYVRRIGMSHTTVADASGFSAQTVSTASDLILLGQATMSNPVLAEIAGQKTAVFPGYGTIQNVDTLLGTAGIRGIKTGNTEEAGGVFLSAADQVVGGRKITVITAVMGAPDLTGALKATVPLVQTTPSLFQSVRVVSAGQNVGKATTAWGSVSSIVADAEITTTAWSGTALAPKVIQQSISPSAAGGAKAGSFTLPANGSSQSSDLKLASSLKPPSLWWRLSHPL